MTTMTTTTMINKRKLVNLSFLSIISNNNNVDNDNDDDNDNNDNNNTKTTITTTTKMKQSMKNKEIIACTHTEIKKDALFKVNFETLPVVGR